MLENQTSKWFVPKIRIKTIICSFLIFPFFYNFYKKQEILVDNKIGNEKKIKITKKGMKNGSKMRKVCEKKQEVNVGQRVSKRRSKVVPIAGQTRGSKTSPNRVNGFGQMMMSSMISWRCHGWCQQVDGKHVSGTIFGLGSSATGSDDPRENMRTLLKIWTSKQHHKRFL